MKILITGARGMLARDLLRTLRGHELRGVTREDMDVTNSVVVSTVMNAWRPQVVIHCAAMTAVDQCESDQDAAWRANVIGSANIAVACQRIGARIIALSTDYVFSGAGLEPYHEWSVPAPRTVYGQSKLAGEEAIRRHCADHLILRVAWLYGPGGPSFVHTMERLLRQSGDAIAVVDDQIGNPTSTAVVSQLIALLIEQAAVGTIHGTCNGETSWYGFAQEIARLNSLPRVLRPCTTAEFPRPAPRPANSRLEKRALRLLNLPQPPDWRDALAHFIQEFPNG